MYVGVICVMDIRGRLQPNYISGIRSCYAPKISISPMLERKILEETGHYCLSRFGEFSNHILKYGNYWGIHTVVELSDQPNPVQIVHIFKFVL